MSNDEVLLERVKKAIETQLGWGDSKNWVNQDFVALSKSISDKTGGSLSSVTLKRLWGKVNYSGLPQAYTLNTLAQFAGYDSWRDFAVKSENVPLSIPVLKVSPPRGRNWPGLKLALIILLCLATGEAGFVTLNHLGENAMKRSGFTFRSHTTVHAGIPNSVVFNFDATGAREDSVIIQQSWDTRLRRKVGKNEHEATMIYYFPGYFNPKLIVGGTVVKEHGLLIPSDGWVTALLEKNIPIYFKKEDVMKTGKMSLPAALIKSQNIAMSPVPPVLSYCNVRDFGPLYTDDFEFETSVKNDFHSESSTCQMTNIYLLCKGTAINIPLCNKGCESALNFYFTRHEVSGKKKDLSAFGVDFNTYVKVRVSSKNGKAGIFINDHLAYEVNQGITRAQIIGIDIAFHGTGSVDYVRLHNGHVKFDDEFNKPDQAENSSGARL